MKRGAGSGFASSYRCDSLPRAFGAVLALLLLSSCSGEQSNPAATEDAESAGSDGVRASKAASKATSKGLLARVDHLLAAGQPSRAARTLEAGLGGLPEVHKAHAMARVAGCYLAAGRNGQALAWADRSLEKDGGSIDGLWAKGESLRRMMELEQAREQLDAAREKAPDDRRVKLSRARLLFRVDDPSASLGGFEDFLAEAPADDADRATARLEYGRALRGARRHQEAADQFATLLEEDPTESVYYSELATTLYRLKQRKAAAFVEQIYKSHSQRSFQESQVATIREHGLDAIALMQEGIVATQRKMFVRAFDRHRKALAANESDGRVAHIVVDHCLRFFRRREALEVTEKAIRAGWAPRSGAWWLRGRVEIEMSSWVAAQTSFEKCLELLAEERARGESVGIEKGQADAFTAVLGVARAMFEQGELASAEKELARARALSAKAWEPAYWEGRIAMTREDFRTALARLDESAMQAKGLGERPFVDLVLSRAVATGRLGRPKRAVAALVKGLKERPDRVEFYSDLVDLSVFDPTAQQRYGNLAASMNAQQDRIDRLETKLDRQRLEQCGRTYFELGQAFRKFRSASAIDCFLLASDLAPSDVQITETIVPLVRRPQDLFVRLRFTRRLVDHEPESTLALHDLAEIYTRLHIRLEEAKSLAERLHAIEPEESSWALRARATILLGRKAEGLALAREGLLDHPGSEKLTKLIAQYE